MATRIKRTNTVQKVWTWFKWNQCQSCKKEFRRESGYSSYVAPPRNNRIDTRYLCKTCGASFEKADKMFEKMRTDFRSSRVMPPPSPPRKFKIRGEFNGR